MNPSRISDQAVINQTGTLTVDGASHVDDPSKSSQFSGRALTTVGLSVAGLLSASVINACMHGSPRASLLGYVISQVPAALYFVGTMEVDANTAVKLYQHYDNRVKQLAGIDKNEPICGAQTMAWLQASREGFVSQPSHLKKAYDAIYGKSDDSFNNMLDYLGVIGWEWHYDNFFFADERRAGNNFVVAKEPPLHQLSEGDALLIFTKPKEGQCGLPHESAVVKASDGSFTFYDPGASLVVKHTDANECVEQISQIAEQENKEFFVFLKVSPKK